MKDMPSRAMLTAGAAALVFVAGCVDPPPRIEDARIPRPTPARLLTTLPRTTPAPRPPLAIDSEMGRWAERYVELLTPVGAVVLSIDRGEPTRDACNALIAAVYNAKNQLRTASDPDVAEAVGIGFDNATSAGSACLREESGLRDLHLMLAGAGFHLAEKLAAERYRVSLVVPGISDVIGGEQGSEISRRAIAAAGGSLQAPPTSDTATTTTRPPTTVDAGRIVRLGTASRITESNDVWARFAWQASFRNTSTTAKRFNIIVEFVDAQGFTIDSDREYGAEVPALADRTFSGDTLINMPAATRVAQIRTKVLNH